MTANLAALTTIESKVFESTILRTTVFTAEKPLQKFIFKNFKPRFMMQVDKKVFCILSCRSFALIGTV